MFLISSSKADLLVEAYHSLWLQMSQDNSYMFYPGKMKPSPIENSEQATTLYEGGGAIVVVLPSAAGEHTSSEPQTRFKVRLSGLLWKTQVMHSQGKCEDRDTSKSWRRCIFIPVQNESLSVPHTSGPSVSSYDSGHKPLVSTGIFSLANVERYNGGPQIPLRGRHGCVQYNLKKKRYICTVHP